MPAEDVEVQGPSSAETEDRLFAAAPADLATTVLVAFTALVMAALVLGGTAQTVFAVGDGDLAGVARGAGFALLGVAITILMLARVPAWYRLDGDPVLGTVLVIGRRHLAPIRLVLARYESIDAPRRIVFPWVPLLSGSRFLGLRGGKIEESIAGFWSFGRDGRRAVVFSGKGRPRTLISPVDRGVFIDAIRRRADVQGLIAEDEGGSQ